VNETTKRYPRTLQQAFGPHTSTSLCSGDCRQGRDCDCAPNLPMTSAEATIVVVVYAASAAAAIGALFAAGRYVGWW
jgi:hypothetical protein